MNTTQLFNFYIAKKGTLDFFNLGDHIFGFINSLLALIATLLAWQIAGKWRIHPKWKVLQSFFLAFIIFACLGSLYFSIVRWYHGVFIDFNQILGHVVFSLSLSFIPVAGIGMAYLYFRDAEKQSRAMQHLELERQQLQMQLLNKNLEPHFLFNNLSILSALMQKDTEAADTFLQHLADVYRYFLKHSTSDLVSLDEEISFLKKYEQLIKTRFGNAYKIHWDIEPNNAFMVPFAIHTCIENAIKHNAASEEDVLPIYVILRKKELEIYNPIRAVEQGAVSHQIGLENIRQRCKMLMAKDLRIEKKDAKFHVYIPLL